MNLMSDRDTFVTKSFPLKSPMFSTTLKDKSFSIKCIISLSEYGIKISTTEDSTLAVIKSNDTDNFLNKIVPLDTINKD